MQRSSLPIIIVLMCVASCGSLGADRTIVAGTGPDELLKLRSGPGLGYNVVLGLPDGTLLNRHDCVTEVGQRWCEVSLAGARRLTGYVAADYLLER